MSVIPSAPAQRCDTKVCQPRGPRPRRAATPVIPVIPSGEGERGERSTRARARVDRLCVRVWRSGGRPGATGVAARPTTRPPSWHTSRPRWSRCHTFWARRYGGSNHQPRPHPHHAAAPDRSRRHDGRENNIEGGGELGNGLVYPRPNLEHDPHQRAADEAKHETQDQAWKTVAPCPVVGSRHSPAARVTGSGRRSHAVPNTDRKGR